MQAAVDRWLALSFRAYTGDPGVQTDSPTAWADREHWPSRMKHRIDEFNLEAVHALVEAAAQAAPKKYFTAGRLGPLYRSTQRQSRGRVARLAGEGRSLPRHRGGARFRRAADQAGALRARWDEQLERRERRRSRNPCRASEDVGRPRSLVGFPALASRGDPLDALRACSAGCGIPRAGSRLRQATLKGRPTDRRSTFA